MIDYYKHYFLDVPPIIYEHLKPVYRSIGEGPVIMSFNLDEMPIPLMLGDIFKINEQDYLLIEFGNIHYSGKLNENRYQSLLFEKINRKDNSQFYTKRRDIYGERK